MYDLGHRDIVLGQRTTVCLKVLFLTYYYLPSPVASSKNPFKRVTELPLLSEWIGHPSIISRRSQIWYQLLKIFTIPLNEKQSTVTSLLTNVLRHS